MLVISLLTDLLRHKTTASSSFTIGDPSCLKTRQDYFASAILHTDFSHLKNSTQSKEARCMEPFCPVMRRIEWKCDAGPRGCIPFLVVVQVCILLLTWYPSIKLLCNNGTS